LPRHFVAAVRQILFGVKQRETRGQPFITCAD